MLATIQAGWPDCPTFNRTRDGDRTWILAPEDEVLYLAVHAARHRFSRLGWLVDLELLIERHPELAWDAVGARAGALHVRRAAAVAFAVLEKRLRVALPPAARAALPKPDLRVRAARLLISTAVDRTRFYSSKTGVAAKTLRVVRDHTFQALLGEAVASDLGYWWRSLRQSAGRLRAGSAPRR